MRLRLRFLQLYFLLDNELEFYKLFVNKYLYTHTSQLHTHHSYIHIIATYTSQLHTHTCYDYTHTYTSHKQLLASKLEDQSNNLLFLQSRPETRCLTSTTLSLYYCNPPRYDNHDPIHISYVPYMYGISEFLENFEELLMFPRYKNITLLTIQNKLKITDKTYSLSLFIQSQTGIVKKHDR